MVIIGTSYFYILFYDIKYTLKELSDSGDVKVL